MAEPGPDHRERTLADLRRMFERCETEGLRAGGLSDKARQRHREDAALLKDAIHYLGADEHLARASAAKRSIDPTLNALLEAMLPDLLLILIQRLGGAVDVPVDEIDARPKGLVLDMQVITRVTGQHFWFVVRKKA